jgi:septal ring factor EnvC (AmiA/AmiB activator)
MSHFPPPIDLSQFFGYQNTVLVTIQNQLNRMEKRMAENDQTTSQLLADFADVQKNVAETGEDIKAAVELLQKNTETIASMEVTIHQLEQQIGNNQATTLLSEGMSALKTRTRTIADIFTPPAVEVPPVTTEPAPTEPAPPAA